MGYNFTGNPVDYQPPQPKAVAPPPPLPKTGPTGFWGRVAQVGVGKVNLYNAYRTTVEHQPSVNSNNSPLKTAARDVGGAAEATGRFAKRTGSDIVSAPVGLAKDANQSILQPILHGKQDSNAQNNAAKLQSQVQVLVKQGKVDPRVIQGAKKVSAGDNTQLLQMIVSGKSPQEQLDFINKSATAQSNKQKRVIAEGVGTGTLLYGGGEVKGTVTGGRELLSQGVKALAKKAVENTAATVAGDVSSKLQKNPGATAKELTKDLKTDVAFGVGTTGLSAGASKIASGAKTALGKDKAVTSTIEKAKTSALLQKGEQANKASSVGRVATKEPAPITNPSRLLPTHQQSLQTRVNQIDARMNELQGKTGTKFEAKQPTLATAGTERVKTEAPVKANGEPDLRYKAGKSQATFAPEKGTAVPNESLTEYKSLKAERAQLTKQLEKTPSAGLTKITNAAKGKASAASAEIPKEASTSSAKLTRPKGEVTTKEPLVSTNKNSKGVGKLISTATGKTKTKGFLNPEQGLSRAGHTDAATLVRDTGAKFSAAHERGEKILSELPKQKGYNPNVDQFATDIENKTGKTAAHQQVIADYQDTGKRGVQAGSLDRPRDETYFPRNYKSENGRTGDFQGGLRKTGGYNQGRVQAGEFGEGGDKYATRAEANAAAQKAGLKLPTATTAEIHAHNIVQREKAIANAEFLNKAEKTVMNDSEHRPMMITAAPGKNLPSKYSDYNTSLLPGRAVHPDAVRAVKGLMDTGSGKNILSRINTGTKRLVTVNGVIHDLNYARSSLGEQGLAGTTKGLLTPANREVRLEASRNGAVFSGGGKTDIYDKTINGSTPIGKQVNGVLGKVRGKMDKVVFGIGDRLGESTYSNVKKGLVKRGLSEEEAGKVAADAANRVMFTQRAGESSQEARSVGRVALFAKNFFQSTLQKATTATGVSRNNALSQAAQRASQKQAAKSLARTFTYLFTAAQAINYHATGHSTFQNKDSKISPVFYVDKNTGKAYHLTNWYGQVGELLHLTDPKAIINKTSPGIQQIARILSNKDQLSFSGGGNVRDTSGQTSGIRQWAQVLANSLEHLVTPVGIDSQKAQQIFGKGGQPGKVSGANLFGFGTSANDQNAFDKDILNRYYATLPSGTSKTPPALSALEAKARHDLAQGNNNSDNLKQLQSQMTATQFKNFSKNGGDNQTQRAFDKLSTDQKLEIIEKYSPDQLKQIDTSSIANTLVDSSAKTVITSLQNKGYSSQRIQQDLQKIGIDSSQLKQIKAEAKKQAAIKARQSARQPKFVNPLLR